MSTRVKIFTVAEVPAHLAHAYVQHMRDFDTAHAECHFEIMADVPGMSLMEAVELLRLNPALSFQDVLPRKSGA